MLNDLPKEWIDLLSTMPELKEAWIEYREDEDADIIPEYFFTLYYEDDYLEKYADYKPFLLV